MSVASAEEKQVSAINRRKEQRKRWEDSETNLEPTTPKKDSVKVKFQDGCVFLAACSSGDKEEVKKLLQRGADINTANVDGLTALHQACIDDNIEMVEFLVEHGADVDVCDNEGWTPLHATASCAFTEIARYLIKHGANVAAVNNDGDLPSDIAENEEMEKLLKDEMHKQGIDETAAKCEEEQRMLEDANKWLKDKNVDETRHPKTGATALHVAAAKGYMKVMSLLLEAGVDINAEDFDGWTPLHAAAHWGQEDACKLLVENMCDMMHKNKAGHTAFDLADKDMLAILEELKEKQASYKNNHEIDTEIILPPGHGGKRRSSVSRMSGDQKQNMIQRTAEEERAALSKYDDKTANSTVLEEYDETETERKNERNKQVSQQIQPPPTTSNPPTSSISSWPRTATLTPLPPGAEIRRPDMPKIEEVTENEKLTPVIPTTVNGTVAPAAAAPISTLISTPTTAASTSATVSLADSTVTTSVLFPRPSVSITKVERLADTTSDASVQYRQRPSRLLGSRPTSVPILDTAGKPINSILNPGRDLVSRSISVPARLPTDQDESSAPAANDSAISVPSWRQGLRKTGSTSMVHEKMSENGSNSISRSASSPRLDSRLAIQERYANRRQLSSTGSATTVTTSTTTTVTDKVADRNSYTYGQTYAPLRSSTAARLAAYYPSYQFRHQRETQASADEKTSLLDSSGPLRDSVSISCGVISRTSSPLPNLATSSASTNLNSLYRRSFEPPKRDEETETQRKARAKHARQTRRSTQGVSLEDIEKAEAVLRSNDPLHPTASTTSTTLSSTRSTLSTREGATDGGGVVTSTATTTTPSISSVSDRYSREDSSIISGYRSRTFEDKTEPTDTPAIRSYRRARDDRDLTSSLSTSSDITSNYIPRSQRNSAILSSEPSSLSSSSQSLLRSSSLRTNRLRNCETDLTVITPKAEEEPKNDDSSQDKKDKDEKKESSSIRSRRQRRERRSTGIVYDNEDGEVSKENKTEEDKTDGTSSLPQGITLGDTCGWRSLDELIMSYGSHRYGAGSGAGGGSYSGYTPSSVTSSYNGYGSGGSGLSGAGYSGSGLYSGGGAYGSGSGGAYGSVSGGTYGSGSGGAYGSGGSGGTYGSGYSAGGGGSYVSGAGSYVGSLHGHSPSPYSSSSLPPSGYTPSGYSSGLSLGNPSAYGSSTYTPSSPSPYVPGTSKSLSSSSSSPAPYIPGTGRLGSGSSLGSTSLSSPYYISGSTGLPPPNPTSVLGHGSSSLSASMTAPPTPTGSTFPATTNVYGSTSSLSGRASSSGHGSAYSSRSNSTTSLPGSSSFAGSGLSASLGNLGSGKYSSRYSSNSDQPSSERSQRPISYSEVSRSTGSLDLDYKKKYEDEKSENEKLRKELEETKKSLIEAKAELDKVLKQREKEQPRSTDRDKRTLERKISEMEEELKKMEALKSDNQRLKDENGALIRVISKLSK